MTTTFGREIEGIPTVTSAAERAVRFPSPVTGQKVFNLQGGLERWNGFSWVKAGIPSFSVLDFGAIGDGVADDTAAIQAAENAAAAVRGEVVFPPGTYLYSQLTVAKGTTWRGYTVPNADATNPAVGSVLKRSGNAVGITIHGTHTTTDRVGHNRFVGLKFQESLDVASAHLISAKYADCLVFEHCFFVMDDASTTKGHAIYTEECWDWRFYNCLWKHCGRAATSKSCLYLFNGGVQNTNDFYFWACRFQETDGVSVFFDSSGAGFRNTSFNFTNCKFEDARALGSREATDHVDGEASNVHFVGCQFGGTTTRQLRVRALSAQWTIVGCFFANADGDECVLIEGVNSKVVACHFNDQPVTQYINISGGSNAVVDCTSAGAAPLVNSSFPTETTVLLSHGWMHFPIGTGARLQYDRTNAYWVVRGPNGVIARLGDGFSIGGSPNASQGFQVSREISGATAQYGIIAEPTFNAEATSSGQAIAAVPKTKDSVYTIGTLYGMRVFAAVKGAASTITTLVGLEIGDMIEGATNFAIRTGLGIVQIGGTLRFGSAGALITGHRSGTVVWNPGSLADGTQTTQPVTVTGAALGDTVAVGVNTDLLGLQLSGYVSAADTVTLLLRNNTGGPVDLPNATWRADIWKH